MEAKFRAFYDREQEMQREYDFAEKVGNEEGIAAVRAKHQKMIEEIRAEGDDFCKVYSMMEDAWDRGNAVIDINDIVWDKHVPAMIQRFRTYGISTFTFSATWTNTVETAWLFTKNGCKLEGLVEINGKTKEFMSDKYERVHAFLFTIH